MTALVPHLPALQVVLPLLAGPVAMLLRRGGPAWLLSFAVSVLALGMAIALNHEVAAHGPIRYAMGNFAQPIGIEFRLDGASTLLLIVVSAISIVTLAYARVSVAQEVDTQRQHLFYAAWMLCLAGLLGIVATGDAFNLFVFLEISSFSLYALIAAGRDRRALTASFQYLIMGTVGATFYLIGVAALYAMTGTLNMADLTARLAPLQELRAVKMGFAFIAVGLSLKLALFPLHLWMPSAYAYAPSALTAFMAGTVTKVMAYALLRLVYTVFGLPFAFAAMSVGSLLMVLALLAMFVASVVALFQEDIKRLLAYSSVAQVGYIMLGASLGNEQGLAAGLLHLFNHAVMKTTLFLAVGCVVFRGLAPNLHALSGAARRMPWTMAAAVVGGLSLIGIPLTAGFTSKWQLALAAAALGNWVVVAAILLSSLLAAAYVWRLVEAVYFAPATPATAKLEEAPLALLLPLWTMVLATLYFGVDTRLSMGLATRAAAALIGGGP